MGYSMGEISMKMNVPYSLVKKILQGKRGDSVDIVR